jgi:hypothetical protein
MGGFTFRLEYRDGTPAEPPSFEAAVTDLASWRHDSPKPGTNAPRGFGT